MTRPMARWLVPVATLFLAGCVSAPAATIPIVPKTSGPPATGTPAPTLATASTSESSPGAVAVRQCGQGDVAIGSVDWTGATAAMAGGFTLVNTSQSACTVGGRPTSFAILDPAGHSLGLTVVPFGNDDGLVVVQPQSGATVTNAGVQLFWTNWCGEWKRAGTIAVSLPHLAKLTAPITGLSAPRCDSPGSPSVVEVSPVTHLT